MVRKGGPQESLMSELPKGSLYWHIQEEAGTRPSVEACLPWLQEAGLTWQAHAWRVTSESLDFKVPEGSRILRAVPGQRVLGLTPAEVTRVEGRYRTRLAERGLSEDQIERLLQREYVRPQSKVMAIDVGSLPPDYLGFYRYFHAAPHDEWGIYIFADKVLEYADGLLAEFRDTLFAFTPETLVSCVLFEIFQHEYYHHLVECMATVVETLAAGLGGRLEVYSPYLQRMYRTGLAEHPHAPLEEALANAYAYRRLGFVGRPEPNYRRLLVKLYQEVLKKRWLRDPAGYRSAVHYIDRPRPYRSGNAQLLATMLSAADIDPAPLLLIAARVMPVTRSAFAGEADIPTYLLGDDVVLRRLGQLVPVPNQTYVSLYLPMDTTAIDKYVVACDKQEKAAREERKRKKGQGGQAQAGHAGLPGIDAKPAKAQSG